MKLTEKQLAQLFKQSKLSKINTDVENLNDYSKASNARIAAVEKIVDNTSLSSSYHIINKLENWSKSVANDIAQSRYSIFDDIFAWLKPVMATAALASIVYISYPQFQYNQQQLKTVSNSNQKEMFTANFEDNIVSNKSKSQQTNSKSQDDVIYSGDFG